MILFYSRVEEVKPLCRPCLTLCLCHPHGQPGEQRARLGCPSSCSCTLCSIHGLPQPGAPGGTALPQRRRGTSHHPIPPCLLVLHPSSSSPPSSPGPLPAGPGPGRAGPFPVYPVNPGPRGRGGVGAGAAASQGAGGSPCPSSWRGRGRAGSRGENPGADSAEQSSMFSREHGFPAGASGG